MQVLRPVKMDIDLLSLLLMSVTLQLMLIWYARVGKLQYPGNMFSNWQILSMNASFSSLRSLESTLTRYSFQTE